MYTVQKELKIEQTVNGLKIELVNRVTEHPNTGEVVAESWYVKRSTDADYTGSFKSSERAIKYITSL
jgi:hypothetical protein